MSIAIRRRVQLAVLLGPVSLFLAVFFLGPLAIMMVTSFLVPGLYGGVNGPSTRTISAASSALPIRCSRISIPSISPFSSAR